ncbi:glycosyltransferase [Seohaeicola zhoushanensis]
MCNPPRLAEVRIVAPISIIIPTYREAQNIPFVIERIRALREARDLDLELIFVDDQSNDGSVEAVAAAGLDWVRIIVRDGPRGLSLAVVEGFRAARNEVLVCMDGDLSHPPETIPDLILMLDNGHDLAIGSRYVRGGSTDDDWGSFAGSTARWRPFWHGP